MKKNEDNFLTGKCLIAGPNISDERFKNSLIYICSHNKNGAIGFIVNKEIPNYSLIDISKSMAIAAIDGVENKKIYDGGPIDEAKGFVLHSPDYTSDNTIKVDDQISISSSIEVLEDIMLGLGPRKSMVVLGYASWKPNQLESEIIRNDWIVSKPSFELVFETETDKKWEKAISELGIDISRLSSQVGNA